jgi:hypothetical protein
MNFNEGKELLRTKNMPGGDLYIYRPGNILVLALTAQDSEGHDSWYETLAAIYENWTQEGSPVLLLNAQAAAITPYFRQRIMALRAVTQAASLPSLTALLVKPEHKKELDVIANVSSLGTRQRLRIFTDEAEAGLWLEKNLSES